jgi:hypothetical protein
MDFHPHATLFPLLEHDHRLLVEDFANSIWKSDQTNTSLVGDLNQIRTLSALIATVPLVAAAGYDPKALEDLVVELQSQREN